MNDLLTAYLVQGESVRDIAQRTGEAHDVVRAKLAESGIKVDPGSIRDPVCEVVAQAGYISFSRFAEKHGLDPLGDQARLLGVSRFALEKIHECLRQLAESRERT